MRLTGSVPVDFTNAQFNSLFWKIYQCDSRIILNRGGAGSGKSVSTAQNEVIKSLYQREKIIVIKKVGETLKRTSIPLFIDRVIGGWGLTNEFIFNKTDRILYNRRNRSEIHFIGLDKPDNLKSLEGATRVFLEECDQFEESDFDQVDLRLRENEDVQITGCFNPTSERSWLKKRFFDTTDPDATIFMTTYKDNNFLPESYKRRLENLVNTNPHMYRIYVLNEWGLEDLGNKFAYEYSKEKHSHPTELNPTGYIYLSFDFNVDPISCMVAQRPSDNRVDVIEMIQLKDSNIYELCNYIKAKYGEFIPIVTGDATGTVRNAIVRDDITYYVIIQQQLGLIDTQLKMPRVNPVIEENRVLVNACLRLMDIRIDPVRCERLHYDLQYGAVDQFNKLIKDDRTKKAQQLDALDCFRYYLNTFHRDVMDNFKIKAA